MPKIQNYQSIHLDSFKIRTKKRIIAELQIIRQKHDIETLVLILDLSSAKVLSALFTMTELVGYGVSFIERLEVERKPLPFHALYLITPKESSIFEMLKDYDGKQKYKKAHVFFTSELGRGEMKKISLSQSFLKRLARHSIKEIYLQGIVFEQNVVNFAIPYFSLAFSKDSQAQQQIRSIIAKRFVDLLASFPQINNIRLYYEQTPNRVSQRIAQAAAKYLESYLKKLIQKGSLALSTQASDISFFVTDRSIDVVSPLITSYSYEALLYDLLQIDPQIPSEVSKQLKGSLFDQFRFRHFSQAMQQLPKKLQVLIEKINQENKLEVIDVKDMLDHKQELQVNLQLVKRVWERFKEYRIGQFGQMELSLATGITIEGKQTNSSQLLQQIILAIKGSANISSSRSLRLGLLTALCIKLSREDATRLVSLFPNSQTIFTNLVALGAKIEGQSSKSTKAVDKAAMDRAKAFLASRSLPSQRYSCALEIILPRLIQYLGSPRSQQSQLLRQITIWGIKKAQRKFEANRLVCFISGGLSLGQIAGIRRDESLSGVLLASDSILSANSFLQELGKVQIFSK